MFILLSKLLGESKVLIWIYVRLMRRSSMNWNVLLVRYSLSRNLLMVMTWLRHVQVSLLLLLILRKVLWKVVVLTSMSTYCWVNHLTWLRSEGTLRRWWANHSWKWHTLSLQLWLITHSLSSNSTSRPLKVVGRLNRDSLGLWIGIHWLYLWDWVIILRSLTSLSKDTISIRFLYVILEKFSLQWVLSTLRVQCFN